MVRLLPLSITVKYTIIVHKSFPLNLKDLWLTVLFSLKYIYIFFIFLHISIKVLHNLLEITKCMQKISANANDIFVKQETKWIFHNLLNTHAHEQNISAKTWTKMTGIFTNNSVTIMCRLCITHNSSYVVQNNYL